MYEEVFLKIMMIDKSLYLLLKSFEIKYNFNEKSSYATVNDITLGKDFQNSNTKDRIFILIHELLHILRKHVLRNTVFVNDKSFNNESYNIVADFIINNELINKLKLGISDFMKNRIIFNIPGVPTYLWKNHSVEEILYNYKNTINKFAESISNNYYGDLPNNIYINKSEETKLDSLPSLENYINNLNNNITLDNFSNIIDSKIKDVSNMVCNSYINMNNEIKESNTNWRLLLKQKLNLSTISSWSKLNRRNKFVSGKIKNKKSINIYIDVSGSINSKETDMFIGEIKSIINLSNITGNIIFWSVGFDLIIDLKENIPRKIPSKGGTNFSETWKQTSNLRKLYVQNIIFSDFQFNNDDINLVNNLKNIILIGTRESKEIKNIIIIKEEV